MRLEVTEAWRRAWREGVAPSLSTAGLEALAAGLRDDDPALVQGATTVPPPLLAVQDWPCEGACAVGYAAWKGDGDDTVGAVEEAFARVVFDAGGLLRDPSGARGFLNWFDDTPRDAMRAELLAEVELALAERREAVPA